MSQGYVYALINPSIQDAVKVGKTSRSPEGRAQELSGSTGVATPFIVAYYEFFEDCDSAESFVHAALENSGFRISPNREFFSAPLNEVVSAISQAPGKLEPSQKLIESDESDMEELFDEELDAELQSLELEGYTPSLPWEDLFEQAVNVHYGTEGALQDIEEAIALYKQAAKLGGLRAYESLGSIYEEGEFVREDNKLALNIYKSGAQKGWWPCYAKMGFLFLKQRQFENARKCYDNFFVKAEENKDIWLESLNKSNNLQTNINNVHYASEIMNKISLLLKILNVFGDDFKLYFPELKKLNKLENEIKSVVEVIIRFVSENNSQETLELTEELYSYIYDFYEKPQIYIRNQ